MPEPPSLPRRCRGGGAAASAWLALALPALLLAGTVTGCALIDEEYGASGDRPWVGEGGRIVGFSGSYSYQDTDIQESESFAARLTIDQFLTDEHAIGAYALGQFSNASSDSDGDEQLWGGVHYRYNHHLSKRTSIYGGPSLGTVFFDDKNTNGSALTYGVSGGIRHWLSERVAITVEPTYLRANFDKAAGNDSEEFLVLWGLAFSL